MRYPNVKPQTGEQPDVNQRRYPDDNIELSGPQPRYDTVEVDAGSSSAVHEIDLDESMEEEVQPENQPLEERDA